MAISVAQTPKLCKLPFGSITPCILEREVVRTTITCCGEMSRKSRRWTERLTWKWMKDYDGSVPGSHAHRAFKPKMFEVGGEQCPVEIFRAYRRHRPESMCGAATSGGSLAPGFLSFRLPSRYKPL